MRLHDRREGPQAFAATEQRTDGFVILAAGNDNARIRVARHILFPILLHLPWQTGMWKRRAEHGVRNDHDIFFAAALKTASEFVIDRCSGQNVAQNFSGGICGDYGDMIGSRRCPENSCFEIGGNRQRLRTVRARNNDTGLVQGLKRAQAKRGRADSSSRQRQADHAGLLIRPQDRMAGSIFPRFCFEDDVAPWIMRTAPLIDERDFFAPLAR